MARRKEAGSIVQPRRARGRPKGSKNKPKATTSTTNAPNGLAETPAPESAARALELAHA
ncbi:hypothetical protein BGZ82_003950, partial [Podila clonocystis]